MEDFVMHYLRTATFSDVEAMAYVHATSWKETYTGLLDDQILNKFNIKNRKKMWTTFLQKNIDSQDAYVAISSDRVVGIASWHEKETNVELLTLYVLLEFQSQGIGLDLFKHVENDAKAKGKKLITWVLENNKAKNFYKKMGMRLVKNEEKNLGGTIVAETLLTSP